MIDEHGQALEYRQLIKGPDVTIWKKAMANDLGQLAQGVGIRMKTETNTIFFMYPSKSPTNKKVTYCRIVSTIRLLKSEVHRVRITVGGDRLDYGGNTSAVPA